MVCLWGSVTFRRYVLWRFAGCRKRQQLNHSICRLPSATACRHQLSHCLLQYSVHCFRYSLALSPPLRASPTALTHLLHLYTNPDHLSLKWPHIFYSFFLISPFPMLHWLVHCPLLKMPHYLMIPLVPAWCYHTGHSPLFAPISCRVANGIINFDI